MIQTSIYLFFSCLVICVNIAPAEDTLVDVVNRVAEQETLFEDIEFSTSEEYIAPGVEGTFLQVDDHKLPFSSKETLSRRVVRQDGRFREDRHLKWVADQKTKERTAAWMFDGSVSRASENEALANESAGPSLGQHKVYLHRECSMLNFSPFPEGKLSMLLSGTDAIRAADRSVTEEIKVEDQGVEELDGNRCHRVRLSLQESGKILMYWDLWLAIDRHYFLTQYLQFRPLRSTHHFDAKMRVSKWAEVRSGLWVPAEITSESYQRNFLAEPDWQQHLHTRRTRTVKVASLSPNYEIEHFQTLKLAEGAAVYEVVDNNITKSRRVGEPQSTDYRMMLFITANVILVAIGLAYWRRWRLMASRP